MLTSRRSFLVGLGSSLVAAPAIVRASSLMPVKAIRWPLRSGTEFVPQWRICWDNVLQSQISLLFGAGQENEAQFYKVMRGEHERFKPMAYYGSLSHG